MYADATTATSVQARGASKLSATAEAIRIAATIPTIVNNSVVLNDGFVSSCVVLGSVSVRMRASVCMRSEVSTEAKMLSYSPLGASEWVRTQEGSLINPNPTAG
jgi:hypothetical protein